VATGASLLDSRFAVTVYAASQPDAPPEWKGIAEALGRAIALRGWVLVYGGANVGLMGTCADAALAAGGRVEGVILDTFARVAHRGLHDLEFVQDMRSRKRGLAHRGDAFVALPGAFGTLEEISEILVERQLALHDKPLVLVNPDGFWDPLLEQFRRMSRSGLLRKEYLSICDVVVSSEQALVVIDAARARLECEQDTRR